MRAARPAAALLTLTAAGCAMFTADSVVRSSDSLLPPVAAPPDAVSLQLVFIERPVNDPLLGSCLWNELDQLAGVPFERRQTILENGFRFGTAASQPPPTLGELLKVGLAGEYDGPAGFVNNRQVAMRSGAATDVMVSHDPADWSVDFARDGHPEPHEFGGARGFIRVEVSEVQDGWCEVRLTPEVHHGAERVRHEAGDDGWSLSQSQQIDPVPDASFSVHLNLHEMLVVSAGVGSPRRVGNHFFRREEDGRLMQRVLVLRAASMKQDASLASR